MRIWHGPDQSQSEPTAEVWKKLWTAVKGGGRLPAKMPEQLPSKAKTAALRSPGTSDVSITALLDALAGLDLSGSEAPLDGHSPKGPLGQKRHIRHDEDADLN